MSLYHPRGRSRPTATLVLLISALVIVLAVAVLAAACGATHCDPTADHNGCGGSTSWLARGVCFRTNGHAALGSGMLGTDSAPNSACVGRLT